MTTGLRVVLLLFAIVGFTAAGASLAVARNRFVSERENDFGMMAVSIMLILFAALCTHVAVGFVGVFAFGGVVLWASYVATAQRVGLFRIEVNRPEETPVAGPSHRT
ncbi:MAG: hypothetical protein ACREM1_16495 [Longimicrobiales bacterium]